MPIGDEIERGVAEFGDIMRRDRGRHADRDALRAIGEQIGKGGGQDHRLLEVAGIILAKIDGVFVYAFEKSARDVGHARFGIAVGGGAVAVDIAEIALPVDQRIARGEILRQPHQSVIDRLIAMGMERAHHVADDFRAFLERRAGIEPQDVHAIEDAAMDGLEPVARVRQRPAHDGRKRIGEIALFQRVAQIDRLVVLAGGRRMRFGHGRKP